MHGRDDAVESITASRFSSGQWLQEQLSNAAPGNDRKAMEISADPRRAEHDVVFATRGPGFGVSRASLRRWSATAARQSSRHGK